MSVPIPESYWVEPGRLLAGEYPGEQTDAETVQRLQAFRTAGVTSFLDLTEASEAFYESFSPYKGLLGSGIRYLRTPIPDHRTGTVVGCWLTRQGLTGEQALERIPALRAAIPDPAWNLSPAMKQLLRDASDTGWHHSPQTQQQRDFVRVWPFRDCDDRSG